MIVACVLRSGGDFGPEYVTRLRAGVARHLPEPHRFVCLTDMEIGDERVETVPLETDWPGWWSKFELFRPGALDDAVLYMDLDTLPVGDLTGLASYRGRFAMIESLFQHGRVRNPKLQSGVMAFVPGIVTQRIFVEFAANPEKHMRAFRGDGEFLNAHCPGADRLQHLFPNEIVSFKRQAQRRAPDGASLVCLHGRPRPHDPKAGWAHVAWRDALKQEVGV